MEARFEYSAIHTKELPTTGEVSLTLWEGDLLVARAHLGDGHHDFRWHRDYAEEVVRRINADPVKD